MERPTHAAVQAHAPHVAHEKTQVEKSLKTEEKKVEEKKIDEKKLEKKTDEKKKVEAVKVKKVKKTEALVNGRNLGISTKEAVAVCDFIRGKDVDHALRDLELVTQYKRAVPMRGEVPHRHGNMMAGRYPQNTVKEFIALVKSLKANALMHEMELEKCTITAMAHQASRPYKRFGQGKIKRSNVQLKLVMKTNGGKKK
jgi:ribosomal protein L22